MTAISASCDDSRIDVHRPPPFGPLLPEPGFGEWSADSFSAGFVESSGPAVSILRPGARIGKYELLEQLDQGGQATVFRAWDDQLQREVAIKLSHAALESSAETLSRFLREGALLAQVDHPCLARVFDCGLAEGKPYLVLEYLRGTHLRNYAERVSLSRRRIARMLNEISGAVAAAHDAGILHLDLKPENVMVSPEGRCKLIDFGLGWRVSRLGAPLPSLVVGTREYLSPEQAAGDVSQWNETTDVFGLGGILFTLLTGNTPLPAAVLNPEEIQQHLSGIRAQLDACNADSRLAAICRQSLAADPKERYACVADLRRALNIRRRFLERGIAGLLILMGMCLFCLGLGVFAQAESPADGRDLKDLTRGGWAISPDSRMTLTLEIRTRSSREPQVLIWSPSLGLQELHGLIGKAKGDQILWRPRTPAGSLVAETRDEMVCVLALDAMVDRRQLQQRLARTNHETWMETVQRICTEDKSAVSFVLTPRMTVVPDTNNSSSHRSRAALCQFRQALNELHVPFHCVMISRSWRTTPEWNLDLSLHLE